MSLIFDTAYRKYIDKKINELKNKIFNGDALEELKKLPDESIDCIITSPPYWKLRNYRVANQLGQEKTIDEYVNNLVNIFDQCYRVLKSSGTCWIVISDCYNSKSNSLPKKSLCLVPERFVIKMLERGWILRNKIIWKKNNAMPSPAKTRYTVDFEYIYFFTTSDKYYFKTQLEKYTKPLNRWGGNIMKYPKDTKGNEAAIKYRDIQTIRPNPEGKIHRTTWEIEDDNGHEKINTGRRFGGNKFLGYGNPIYSGKEWIANPNGRLKRTTWEQEDESDDIDKIWTINTRPLKEAHFAAFPEELVNKCLDAGCPDNGIVLDPFMGAGTTALVARKRNINYLGIELNQKYIDMSYKRINDYFNMIEEQKELINNQVSKLIVKELFK